MKHIILGLCLTSNIISGITNSKLYIVSEGNTEQSEIVKKTLDNQNINYEAICSIATKDDQNLYIVCNIQTIPLDSLPKYYIVYQSLNLSATVLNNDYLIKLTQAIAVWDNSFNNIEKYRNQVHNYLYFPANYEYADTITIPCKLPVMQLTSYKKLLEYSNANNTDISSHLPTIFFYAALQNPSIIVEAGVRGGESTIAFKYALEFCTAQIIGIDIEPTSNTIYQQIKNSIFLCMNDLEFDKYFLKNFETNSKLDVVFIDTSHLYTHTLEEIKLFSPLLNENGIILFHDSNVTPLLDGTAYLRLNNTMGKAGGNTRGVTEAIKKYLSVSFDESRYQNFTCKSGNQNWHLTHFPYCNGLTILRKV